jgi:L-threonylcarbamoyladenylate synthase
MKTVLLPAGEEQSISQAVSWLRLGRLVAFPTDTVYGVGALAHNPRGIDQLYTVKGREAAKAIPILIGSFQDLSKVAVQAGEPALRLAERFWPGPLTIVVPKHPSLPGNLSPYPTVGVRMPDHPAALALLVAAGPMAVTSANLSGAANTSTAGQVLEQLGGRISLILDGGATPGGSPSTVVDCTGPQPAILRPGPVSLQEILAALI